METQLFNQESIREAGNLLKNGELVAFPTETVYGLGAIASNEEAVENVYTVKGRPSDNPLIVHVASTEIDEWVADVPKVARKLMDKFWPGPLTLIFNTKAGVFPSAVTGGQETVAMRMPDQTLALQLIKEAGFPLVGPSANTSGKPSPTTAQHVSHDLNDKIAGIVDGGETKIGVESTVLDLTDSRGLIILRPGAVTREALQIVTDQKVWMSEEVASADATDAPKAPGMKYMHYSPTQPVILMRDNWGEKIAELLAAGNKIGVLASDEQITELTDFSELAVYSLGSRTDENAASQRLYAGLRYFDMTNVTVILAEGYPKDGIGVAYMNRLEKAASSMYPE